MNLLRSKAVKLFILLAVIATGVGLQLGYDYRQGVDIDSAAVVEVRFDHDETIQTVTEAARQEAEPIKVEQSGTTQFRLFYQNKTPEQLESVKNRLEESLGTLTESQIYDAIPGTVFNLSQDRMQSAVLYSLSAVILFFLITLHGKNFRLIDVLMFILAELVLMVLWHSSVLFIVMAVISALGFTLSLWLLPVIGVFYLIYASVGVFTLYRFLYTLKDAKPDKISESWNAFADKNFKPGAFAAAVAGVPFLIFVIMPAPQIFMILIILVGAMATLVARFYLFAAFLELLIKGSRKLKLHKRIARLW